MSGVLHGMFLAGAMVSNGSVAFDGSGDYLALPANQSAFTMGTGDFTIECYYYLNSGYASNMYLFDLGGNGTRVQLFSNQVYFAPAAGDFVVASAGVGMSANTWYHIACVRSASTITLYIDGTNRASGTNSSNLTDTACRIGSIGSSANLAFNGYISNFRIVKGTAIYTSNFTRPNRLAAITNTQLLTAQSPTTVTDASTNNFTVTLNGNAAANSLNPF